MEVQSSSPKMGLPKLDTIFPVKRNPLHERTEVKTMCQQIGEFSSMSAEHFNKISGICLFTAYFHPFVTDLTKYVNLCKAMTLFFIIDDHTECDWGDVGRETNKSDLIWNQVDQCFERLIEGTNRISMSGWKPYVVALCICFEDIFRELSNQQKMRIAKEYKRWGLGNKLEGEIINSNRRFETIEEYLQVRKLSIGVFPTCMMIEYADSIELTDEEWARLDNFIEHCSYCVILANDFGSIRKELKEQKDKPHFITNIVSLLMLWNNISIEESLEKTAIIMKDYEHRTKIIKEQLLKEANVSKNMKNVIDNILYIVSGNLIVTLMHPRYSEDAQANI